jgi:tRNA threonylcarbamoyl adenosine modification protein YeaZ
MSLVLALDSSRRRGGSVALAEGPKLLALVEHDPAQGYAEAFFGLADRALEETGRRREEITQLAVVTGPGSYTGLRIGVMTAKSLAHAGGLALFGCTSLELLAGRALLLPSDSREIKAEDGPPESRSARVLSLMEAGRDAVYAALYEARANALQLVRSPWRALFANLQEDLKDESPADWISADGEETLALARDFAPEILKGSKILPPSPMAGSLALAVARECPWCERVEPAALLPVYLGPSQAERAAGIRVKDEQLRSFAKRRSR